MNKLLYLANDYILNAACDVDAISRLKYVEDLDNYIEYSLTNMIADEVRPKLNVSYSRSSNGDMRHYETSIYVLTKDEMNKLIEAVCQEANKP